MDHGAIQKGSDFVHAFMLGFDVNVSICVWYGMVSNTAHYITLYTFNPNLVSDKATKRAGHCLKIVHIAIIPVYNYILQL